MTDQNQKDTRLLTALREGIGLVQMLFYKEIKERLSRENTTRDQLELALLAGAITGEVFAARNPDEKFTHFRATNWAEIEQELFFLHQHHPEMCRFITDALRIQVLCDYQENKNSAALLHTAQRYGYLDMERETPLPSSFMTSVRQLGKEHNLIIPPIQITQQQDKSMIH